MSFVYPVLSVHLHLHKEGHKNGTRRIAGPIREMVEPEDFGRKNPKMDLPDKIDPNFLKETYFAADDALGNDAQEIQTAHRENIDKEDNEPTEKH